MPTAPVLALYVPHKLRRRREVGQVLAALRDDDHSRVDEYLAWRAVTKIPFHELRELSDDPWRDLHEGRHRRLAEAELSRLGLVRT